MQRATVHGMIRILTTSLTALMILSACSGDDTASEPSLTTAEVEVVAETIRDADLLAMLPTLSDLPAGWVQTIDDGEDDDIEICAAIDERVASVDLGFPLAEVAYESADGDAERGARIVAFPTEAAALERLESALATLDDPDCRESSFTPDGIPFDILFRETSTGMQGLHGVLLTLTLADDYEGLDAGTIAAQSISASMAVGRCNVTVDLTDLALFAAIPTASEIEAWTSPIAAAVGGFEPCASR